MLDRKDMRRTDRYIQFGLVAAARRSTRPGCPDRLEGELAERTGVILGSGLGGVNTLFDNVLVMAERGPDRISPFFIPMGIANVGAGQVAIAFGPLGPNFATVSACATGGHAIGEAWETIRRRDADVMIAGGVEAPIHEAAIGGFCSMKALSTRNDDPAASSRPFDAGRDGFVIGEGAGVLILEELEHAEARGATPLAELIGYGATADAAHITLPAPGGIGAVRAARRALEKAGLEPTADRPRQRPRDVDAGGRQGRAPGDQDDLRRACPEGGRHRQQVDARAHPRRGRRDRGDRHDHGDPDRDRPAHDQPGDTGSRGGRARPDAAAGRAARDPDGALQLVRVRRPEHGPDLHEVRGMTDELKPAAGGVPGDGADGSLLAILDRLTGLLERSDLTELEVESGGTGLVLRKVSAIAPAAPAVVTGPPATGTPGRGAGRAGLRRQLVRPAVGQGTADRHLLRSAGVRARRRTSTSAARWPSARSSG